MNPRLAKVLGDLNESRWRSALIALSILIGASALTTALGSRSVLTREIAANYAKTEPPAAVLWLDRVDEVALAEARAQPGVEQADSRRLVRARVEVTPGEWRPLLLYGVRDFRDLRVSKFRLTAGDWPPVDGEILVEQSALGVLHAKLGAELIIRVLGGRKSSVRIGGVVHDAGQAPGWQDNSGYAYASAQTLAGLGLTDALDELRITVPGDRAYASRIAEVLAARFASEGRMVRRIEVPVREHPHADHMRALLTLVTIFAGLALALAAALTATVISGLLARQVRQIGIMKSIGATSIQISNLYVPYILLLAVPAIAVGIAVGLRIADAYSVSSAGQLNIEISNHSVGFAVIAFVVAACLVIPALAAAWPLARAVRMTAREAIQNVGVAPPRVHATGLSLADRTWTLAFRNTFRRPVRLGLTLGALALGGATMMTAANNYAGLVGAVDLSLADRRDDLDVRLQRPLPAAQLLARVRGIPGVIDAEAWGGMLVQIALPEASSSAPLGTGRYGLLGIPSGSTMFAPRMVEGRMPESAAEIAINRAILEHEPELRVGNQVTLLAAGHSLSARVVGLVEEIAEPHLYAHITTFDVITGSHGRAGALRVITEAHAEDRVSRTVEEIVADMGSLPILSMTRPGFRQTAVDHFAILLALLSAAAVAAIVVGGFSLGAATGLNVLERRREIGVMSALGARPRTILRIILAEGGTVALLSIAVAFGLSLPLTEQVNLFVGEWGLKAVLPFIVSLPAIALWGVVVCLISLLACLGPALGVLRRPAREVLASE